MSPRAVDRGRDAEGFPRVSGDEPDFAHVVLAVAVFSPRERG